MPSDPNHINCRDCARFSLQPPTEVNYDGGNSGGVSGQRPAADVTFLHVYLVDIPCCENVKL